MSKRKCTRRAKLKTASQEERIQMWKEHFNDLLANSPKVINKPIAKIINCQLEELNEVLRKIKNRKVTGLDELPPEVWKIRKFEDLLLRFCNVLYKQDTKARSTKAVSSPFK